MKMLLPILCLLASCLALEAAEEIIALQPYGSLAKVRLEVVRKGLKEAFGLEISVLDAKPLPQEAWYAPRQRYRAEKLLTDLDAKAPGQCRIIIGLTAKDISTTKGEHPDWGIFGLGELGGRTCVVSTFRLGARGADEVKLRDRLRKVAIHEAGHVMGLDHCLSDRCVMRDAESSIATVDDETGRFCDTCAKLIRSWMPTPSP
jgi:archaemetzincin